MRAQNKNEGYVFTCRISELNKLERESVSGGDLGCQCVMEGGFAGETLYFEELLDILGIGGRHGCREWCCFKFGADRYWFMDTNNAVFNFNCGGYGTANTNLGNYGMNTVMRYDTVAYSK
jgi:hypothetical protein